ncbi:MAG: molybdopterin-synthase adenylyltransferase MoeB [Deltaproteobacteria bacterium]|nr:molybdopterin-synthase adenylyltransferase MoeB [Candidatus Caldarchaeum sp.]MDW8002748.1 molybdopterin-synthase adenylyltransferase MoeB [Deltaproteobacteria bacterium]
MDTKDEKVPEISIHELAKILKSGNELVLIDIREKEEIQTGYLKGAIFLSQEEIPERIVEMGIDLETPLIVYCGFGIKSLDAGRKLKRLGYKRVYTLREGFEGWRAAGYEFSGDAQFSPEQLTRYSRHILLKEVGIEGQRRLLQSKVLIVGAGGLGSPAALYLAAAGVGTIGIIDHDVVDLSNLQRQVIHTTQRVGVPKVESARETLKNLNPDVRIITYNERLSKENGLRIFSSYDLVIDGSDNFPTKFLINDLAYFSGIPYVFGGVFQFEGQISVFHPHAGGPCLRCVFPKPPPQGVVPSCSEVGILGVVPGLIGILQAQESIKVLLGIGDPLIGRFLNFDALRTNILTFTIRKNPSCNLCGENPSITGIEEAEEVCESRTMVV